VAQRAEETAMYEGKDIILVADYHAENIEFRWFNQATGLPVKARRFPGRRFARPSMSFGALSRA